VRECISDEIVPGGRWAGALGRNIYAEYILRRFGRLIRNGRCFMSLCSEEELARHINSLEHSRRAWKLMCLILLSVLPMAFFLTSRSYSQQEGQVSRQSQPSAQWNLDTSTSKTVYANYFHIDGTPEELVVDCGLIDTATKPAAKPLKIDTRLVMSYYTTKRLLNSLSVAVRDHERVYGELETDIPKRAKKRADRSPNED
jgi:hypothetical protein